MEDAVFLPSGVMAQSIVLMICKGAKTKEDKGRKTFVCHKTSHLLMHEKDSYLHLLDIDPVIIDTSQPITASDVESSLSPTPKPSCVIIEHPHRELGGTLTPFEILTEISSACKSADVHLHLDGARIWEASGSEGGKHTPADICANFDSAYVSFYKGLGGMAGAMLLGDKGFCEEARVWSRRFGGNLHTLAPLWVGCWAGYRRNFKIIEEGR